MFQTGLRALSSRLIAPHLSGMDTEYSFSSGISCDPLALPPTTCRRCTCQNTQQLLHRKPCAAAVCHWPCHTIQCRIGICRQNAEISRSTFGVRVLNICCSKTHSVTGTVCKTCNTTAGSHKHASFQQHWRFHPCTHSVLHIGSCSKCQRNTYFSQAFM